MALEWQKICLEKRSLGKATEEFCLDPRSLGKWEIRLVPGGWALEKSPQITVISLHQCPGLQEATLDILFL